MSRGSETGRSIYHRRRTTSPHFSPALKAPRIAKAISALSQLWGETIVPCGAAAANRLRLTTQNPVRMVYLTSGPSRRLRFGSSVVELRHAPRWQLAVPHRWSPWIQDMELPANPARLQRVDQSGYRVHPIR